jgi:hypothetical protein
MHCELIVPRLFAEPTGTRAPALELLLARGRGSSGEPQDLESWLQDGFGLSDQPIAAGALTLAAANGNPGEACWARADPLHLRLVHERLIVVPGPGFALSREEADALCESLNRHFTGILALQVVDPLRWCARLEQDLPIDAASPLEVAGRDVDLSLPAGEAGRRWHALLNEAQMLLHAHPVNEAREARGEPAVNSLWLWGVGRAPHASRGAWHSVSAADPVALGFARLAGARALALPDSASGWLEATAPDGRHLIVLDALRAPHALGHAAEYREGVEALEARWFAPLLAALRSGRLGMVTLRIPDAAGAAFETIRGDLRRFWRRPRALERYA